MLTHKQTTIFDTRAPLREEKRFEPDEYIAITAEKGMRGELDLSPWEDQIVAESSHVVESCSNHAVRDIVNGTADRNRVHAQEKRDLCFIPYYMRANRGGKGHMRVGLRVE